MSLKSIKKNYTDLLKMFKDIGVTLTESQKKTFDNFMLDLESTMEKNRDDAIRATKKIVEEKLEKEYSQVIGSIFANQKKIDTYKGLIKDKINESKSEPLVDQLDSFLNEHLESVISKKQIVDYSRLQKLESIQESLRDMLVAKSSEDVAHEMTEKINRLQKDLNESIKTNIKLSKQINESSEEKPEEKPDETTPAPAGNENVQEKPAEQPPADDGDQEKNLEEAIEEILEKNTEDAPVAPAEKETTEKNSTDANVEGTEPETGDDIEENEDDSKIFQESMISWLGTLEKQQYTKL